MSAPVMRLLTRDGVEDLPVRNDAEASLLGSYWNAVQRFLATGEEEGLARFGPVQVGGKRLEVDPDRIEFWARYGELDFEDIYESRA